MVIDTREASEATITSTWMAIWVAAERVTARCVRAGSGGNVTVRGSTGPGLQSDLLRLTVMDEPVQLGLPGGRNKTEEEAGSHVTA